MLIFFHTKIQYPKNPDPEVQHIQHPKTGSETGEFCKIQKFSIRNPTRCTSLVGSRLLDDESLQTLLAEVERILNNRPITPISNDPRDTACLTPSILIHTKLDPCLPADKFIYADGYKKAWRTVPWQADRFWQRWLKEYVTLLQLRQKWLKPEGNLAVGDLVLLVDSNLKRGHLPKGIVERVLRDAFNVVRTVKVRTATGSFVRDIRKVCLLETAK